MRWCFLILILTLLSFSVRGQYGSFGVTDARSLGMGNTYTATTYDLYAIGKNPGLLPMRHGNEKVSFIFPNLTAQQYGIGNMLSTFDYYSTNKLRSDGIIELTKDKFKLAIENNGKIFVDGLIGFFSAAYHPGEHIGSFAFSMSDYITAYMDIPDIILEVNYGDEIKDGTFNLDNFTFKSWWIRSYALSYGRYLYKNDNSLLKNISGGITLKYMTGYAYTDIGLSANATYSTATQTLSGSYQARSVHAFSEDLSSINSFNQEDSKPRGFLRLRPAAYGYAVDLGFGAELQNGFIFGLAITDLGNLKWTGAAKTSNFDGYVDISGVIDHETIDSLAHEINLESEVSESFSTPTPTALRLGLALQFEKMFNRFPGELLVGFDYNQGLNNEPSNFTASRFSLGFEYRYKPKWPSLLGGYTYDLLKIGRGAIGLGYQTHFADIYVSTIDIFSIVVGGDRLSGSLIIRWKILSGRKKNHDGTW